MIKLLAKKSLGQNFLVNQGVVGRIIKAAELSSNDKVVEVGPGSGILTKELALHAGQVVAVEKDSRAIELLKKELPRTVTIIEDDILTFDPQTVNLKEGEYKVVANLPYYITSHFLRLMLDPAVAGWPRPELAVLMVQKEVAQRMTAKPPDMNLLALSVQYYADAEIVMRVSRGSFRPIPNVDSAIIKLIPKNKFDFDFGIIKMGFQNKRKTLVNNLSSGYTKEKIIESLRQLGLGEKIRPENLSLEDWSRLSSVLQ
jgi:16S rRNA (adenine1518-N6/adenine1519-N6)-dimethyltransferase